jgi:GT2 family glycosyltransferase
MLITVVTPTLNAIRYLPECIESTRIQEGPDVHVEHLVGDGGSTAGPVAGGGRWLDGEGRPRGDIPAAPTWITVPMLASLGWNCISHTATYVHRDLFEELGGFDKHFQYFGDYDFMLRALASEPFCRVDRTLSSVRRHGANASMQQTPTHWAETEEITQRYGPTSSWKRAVYRYRLKVWANASSPRWFLHKRMDRFRA